MRLKSAAKDWQRFLEEKYEGGRKKIRNPNSDTKDVYPEVSFNTAMKDEHFRKHVEEDYKQWKGSDTENHNFSVAPPLKSKVKEQLVSDEISVAKSSVVSVYETYLNDPDYMVRDIINLCEIISSQNKTQDDAGGFSESNYYSQKYINYDLCAKYLKGLSEKERFCIDGIYNISSKFIDSIYPDEKIPHTNIWQDWMYDSASYSSLKICKWLKSMGVSGSLTDSDANRLQLSESIDEDTCEILKKAYTYHQSVFKHLGITHVTLYRGVSDDQLENEPPLHGDKVKVGTRPMSSWSPNPQIGLGFGTRIIQCKVPVERIIASAMTVEKMGHATDSEFEYVVLGAEDFECEVFGKPYG